MGRTREESAGHRKRVRQSSSAPLRKETHATARSSHVKAESFNGAEHASAPSQEAAGTAMPLKDAIQAEMTHLLDSCEEYNKTLSSARQRSKRVAKTQQTSAAATLPPPLVSPVERYPLPDEDLVETLSKTVETEAEVRTMISKLNSVKAQRTFETVDTHPVETWPTINEFWNDTLNHNNLTMESIHEAFREDLRVLQNTLSYALPPTPTILPPTFVSKDKALLTNKQDHARDSKALNENIDTPSSRETSTHLRGEEIPRAVALNGALWDSEQGPDAEVYTDSDEELEQRALRFPPFVRPLRRVVRHVKRKEKLNYVLAQKLSNLHQQLDVSTPETSTTLLPHNSSSRAAWRKWDRAARLALWLHGYRPSAHFSNVQNSVKSGLITPENLASFKHFQLIQENCYTFPKSLFCLALLRYYARQHPYTRDSSVLKTVFQSSLEAPGRLPFSRNPFQWTIWNADKLLSLQSAFAAADTDPYRVVSSPPGLRLYVGRATTIWGSPVAEGYQRVAMPSELMFWFRRCTGPLVPLGGLYRLRAPATQTLRSRQVASFEQQDAGSSALTSALFFHTQDSTAAAAACPSDLGVRVIHDYDSTSEAEEDEEQAQPIESFLVNNRHQKSVRDFDVVRIGRFGRVCSAWETRSVHRRANIRWKDCSLSAATASASDATQAESVCNETVDASLCPSVYDYSSEESCNEFIESQSAYRRKARESRQRSKEQRLCIIQCLTSEKKHETRRSKLLSALYSDTLGPLEPAFRHPSNGPQLWPPSCLSKYLSRIKSKPPSTKQEETPQHLLAPTGERWTYMSHKKGRVRNIEPLCDEDRESRLPLGFLSRGTDLAGKQYHCVGVDQNEFWRRFGNNKLFHKTLHGYGNMLKGTREYYAVIDEEEKKVTLVPGATLALFWFKTPQQASWDLHWFAFWRLWMIGRFRRRLTQKVLRYQALQRQGWFIWRQRLDKLGKIVDRIREASAYPNAKATRLSTRYFSAARQDLATLACPNFSTAENKQQSIQDVLSACLGPNAIGSDDASLADDWQDAFAEDLPTCSSSLSDIDLTEEAKKCAEITERHYSSYHYASLHHSALKGKVPFWAWGWTNNVPKLARGASRRYGPIVSRYYRKTLPMFTPTYRMARSVIAEKLQAELEYLQQRKHTQQRPETNFSTLEGSAAATSSAQRPSILTQQLSGALATLERTAVRHV